MHTMRLQNIDIKEETLKRIALNQVPLLSGVGFTEIVEGSQAFKQEAYIAPAEKRSLIETCLLLRIN